jgi:hypothetical protein
MMPQAWLSDGVLSMKRVVLTATVLSLAVVSAVWAAPFPSSTQQLRSPDIVDVGYKGDKKYNKNKNWKYGNNKNWKYGNNKNWKYGNKYRHKNRYAGNYWHGGRYWGHRYSYRPYGWQTLGCVAVGPIWYCP